MKKEGMCVEGGEQEGDGDLIFGIHFEVTAGILVDALRQLCGVYQNIYITYI